MNVAHLAIGVACSFALACGDAARERDADPMVTEPPTNVHLRLRNTSQVDFDAILVQVNEPIEFGALAAGADSAYLVADGIYSYAYVEGTSGSVTYILQPTDFIGEQPLEPAYYTYVLSAGLTQGAPMGWIDLSMNRDRAPD